MQYYVFFCHLEIVFSVVWQYNLIWLVGLIGVLDLFYDPKCKLPFLILKSDEYARRGTLYTLYINKIGEGGKQTEAYTANCANFAIFLHPANIGGGDQSVHFPHSGRPRNTLVCVAYYYYFPSHVV